VRVYALDVHSMDLRRKFLVVYTSCRLLWGCDLGVRYVKSEIKPYMKPLIGNFFYTQSETTDRISSAY